MNKRFTVSFFWNGKRREIESFCDHWPINDLDASGLAYLAIKTWFEDQKFLKPEIARNVDFVAQDNSYHWDILQL